MKENYWIIPALSIGTLLAGVSISARCEHHYNAIKSEPAIVRYEGLANAIYGLEKVIDSETDIDTKNKLGNTLQIVKKDFQELSQQPDVISDLQVKNIYKNVSLASLMGAIILSGLLLGSEQYVSRKRKTADES